MTAWLLLALSVLLVVACGAFVAAEFAFVTVDRATVNRAAEAGDAPSRGLLAALKSLSTQLSGAQLGITLTNLAIGFLAEPALAHLLHAPLRGIGLPDSAVRPVAIALALIVATATTMIYGELVPKNLAIARPLDTARRLAGPQRAFTRAMAVPIRLLNGTANALVRRLGIEPQEELASARSPDELSSLVARSAEQGTLAAPTATLLQRTLSFGDRTAADVLTPRVRLRTLSSSAPVSAVLDAARRTGHSRFPVIAEDADDIVGLVHIKQAVAVAEGQRGLRSVATVMAAPEFVPETLHLDPLLAQLRRSPLQMVVVLDEFGGTAGVVTIEDLVEELVGEVSDEHDRYGPAFRHRRDGSWILSGLLRPDEITAETGVAIPEDRSYETLAGLILRQLGRLPEAGDVVELASGRLTVTHVSGRRIDRVRLEPRSAAGPATGEPEGVG